MSQKSTYRCVAQKPSIGLQLRQHTTQGVNLLGSTCDYGCKHKIHVCGSRCKETRVVCNFQIIDYNACYNKHSSLKEMQVAMNFQVQTK